MTTTQNINIPELRFSEFDGEWVIWMIFWTILGMGQMGLRMVWWIVETLHATSLPSPNTVNNTFIQIGDNQKCTTNPSRFCMAITF